MTFAETTQIFALIAALYPRDKYFGQAEKPSIRAWAMNLQDIPFDLAAACVNACAVESDFPPSVYSIRKYAFKAMKSAEAIDADEAWGYVENAIRKYGFYQVDKAKKSMPIAVWKLVERFGWRDLCMSEAPGVDRGQFIKLWEIQQKRETEKGQLTPELRILLDRTTENLTLPGAKEVE